MNNENIMCKLPYELKNRILDYYGYIKYKIKHSIDYHKYVNVIHKYDQRYDVLQSLIERKIEIMQKTDIYPNNRGFNFMFCFKQQPCMIFYYEYHKLFDTMNNCLSNESVFKIQYVVMKEARAINMGDIIETIF